MGYHTEFRGEVLSDKPFTPKMAAYLNKFADTRRMKRKQDDGFGIDGEFYVDGAGFAGQAHEPDIVDYNKPPATQPSLWCQWIPNSDGTGLEWDRGEKFYSYVDWMVYLIRHILNPNGYKLNGTIEWCGEDPSDTGTITVCDNIVSADGYATQDCNELVAPLLLERNFQMKGIEE